MAAVVQNNIKIINYVKNSTVLLWWCISMSAGIYAGELTTAKDLPLSARFDQLPFELRNAIIEYTQPSPDSFTSMGQLQFNNNRECESGSDNDYTNIWKVNKAAANYYREQYFPHYALRVINELCRKNNYSTRSCLQRFFVPKQASKKSTDYFPTHTFFSAYEQRHQSIINRLHVDDSKGLAQFFADCKNNNLEIDINYSWYGFYGVKDCFLRFAYEHMSPRSETFLLLLEQGANPEFIHNKLPFPMSLCKSQLNYSRSIQAYIMVHGTQLHGHAMIKCINDSLAHPFNDMHERMLGQFAEKLFLYGTIQELGDPENQNGWHPTIKQLCSQAQSRYQVWIAREGLSIPTQLQKDAWQLHCYQEAVTKTLQEQYAGQICQESDWKEALAQKVASLVTAYNKRKSNGIYSATVNSHSTALSNHISDNDLQKWINNYEPSTEHSVNYLDDTGSNFLERLLLSQTINSVALQCEGIKKLLTLGIDPNVPNEHGYYPLHYAMSSGRDAIVRCLIDGNAQVDIIDSRHDGNTLLHNIIQYCDYDNDCSNIFATILKQDEETRADRLENSVSLVNTKNSLGHTPLMSIVCKMRDFSNYLDVGKMWQLYNALCRDVTIDLSIADDDGNTALHHAVSGVNKDLIVSLVMYKANPYLKNEEGKTAFEIIVQKWPEILFIVEDRLDEY